MFNFFKKKSKPEQAVSQEPLPPEYLLVPAEDLELLKQIRLALARGQQFVINPTWDAQALQNNAKILNTSYGLTEHEVLVETGFWVGKKEAESKEGEA